MKNILSFVVLAAAVLVLFPGCGPRSEVAALAEETIAVPEFSENKGLSLPEQTRQSLGLKIVEVGERKIAATTTLQLKVYQVAGNRARASSTVAASAASHLQVGQTIPVNLHDGVTWDAKITAIDNRLLVATGSAEVLVEITNAPEAVAVGTFLKANVLKTSAENVITIPRAALLSCSEGQFVYTTSGDHFVRTAVKTGAKDAEFVEIVDGLYSGDQVVSQPVMALWMTELAAVKGGQACCALPAKGK